MVLLDTHAFVYEALDRTKLSRRVRSRIASAARSGALAISDITLWEIAMLVAHGRLDVGTGTEEFLHVALESRSVRVLPVTPAIAQKSADVAAHADPADRIILATALVHGATLVTADRKLRLHDGVDAIW